MAALDATAQADGYDGAPRAVAGEGGEGAAPELRYLTVDAFVDEFLAEFLWLDVEPNSVTWCPQWWQHAGAIVRLEALWRSFEFLRQDPGTGMSTWFKDHADYHLRVLTDPAGVFKGCSVDRGHDTARHRIIATEQAPAGLFAEGD